MEMNEVRFQEVRRCNGYILQKAVAIINMTNTIKSYGAQICDLKDIKKVKISIAGEASEMKLSEILLDANRATTPGSIKKMGRRIYED